MGGAGDRYSIQSSGILIQLNSSLVYQTILILVSSTSMQQSLSWERNLTFYFRLDKLVNYLPGYLTVRGLAY